MRPHPVSFQTVRWRETRQRSAPHTNGYSREHPEDLRTECRVLNAKCSPMDFEQLETFLEVARHSSFSRAAEKRFRTQPAISSQIRALEEEVGAKLLDRSGGKVPLTASGKLFFKYAEETLERRKTILTEIPEPDHLPPREIVVAAIEG